MKRLIIIVLLIFSSSISSSTIVIGQTSNVKIIEKFPGLTFEEPVDLQYTSGRLFVVERPGRIQMVVNDSKHLFLDISNKVADTGSEMGLLGLTFSPDFDESGNFFVDYTASEPRRTVIARYSSTNFVVDEGSAVEVFSIEQPYSNHNAGTITFGTDNLLYITLGDGGSGGDPLNNGQDFNTFLGSILRINVTTLPYTIPPNNPFVGKEGLDEIFAYGLRNPWKISFDQGILYAADVGQNEIEEINIIAKGNNYGWNIMEGSQCYDSESCDTTGLELPWLEYSHSVGQSITGGYVLRDSDIQGLYGHYIFGDFSQGKIWQADIEGDDYSLISDTGFGVSTFGKTPSGNLLFTDYFAGKIYTFQAGLNATSSNTHTSDFTDSSTAKDTDTESLSIFSHMVLILPVCYRQIKQAQKE